jgi:hypothetical protein
MLKKKHSKAGVVFSFIFSLLILTAATYVVLDRQGIYDQWNFLHYKPTAQIADIANLAGLSDKGKFYLYTSDAAVDNAADFNKNCVRQEAKNAILGCYSNNRVYIYNVTNQELNGIEEVTAAHEMLHAVWDRTSASEKTRIGALLEQAYTANKTPDLTSRMDYYSRNESGERINELHSIAGTEFKNLSPELEKYYALYFTNRQNTVTLHDKYNSVFTKLSTDAEALYQKLVALGASIKSDSAAYNQAVVTLNRDIQTFNEVNGFSKSTSQFNTERAAIVSRIAALNAQRDSLDAKIKDYNVSYADYQALVVKNESLNQSIDSTIAQPAPSL